MPAALFSFKPLFTAFSFLCVAMTLSVAHADDYAEVNRLTRSGQYAEALAKAEKYLTSKPRDPQMRFSKGVIQTETGKTKEAIATFSKIVEDYPELPEPYNNMAVIYAGESQFDKARAALEMAIRTNPSYGTAHENLGDVYARLASQAYGKALQLDSNNAGVQPKLALIRNLFSLDSKAQQKSGLTQQAPTGAPPSLPTVAKPVIAPSAASTNTAAPIAKSLSAPATTVVVAEKPVSTALAPPPSTTASATFAVPATLAVATTASSVSTAENSTEKEVTAALRAWADAWSTKDMNAYLSSYGQNFNPPGAQARKAWESDRRARIVGKSSISVTLSNVAINVQGAKATARFKQDYSADALNVTNQKMLDMVKVDKRWVIVREYTVN